MHNGASGQRHITGAMSASNHPWSRYYALRLVATAAGWARESARPPNRFKIGCTRHFAGKNLLELKQRLGLENFHDDNTLPIAVGCVNRTSKLQSLDVRSGLKPGRGVLEDGLKTGKIKLFPCLTVGRR
jgi:hypothetical protein